MSRVAGKHRCNTSPGRKIRPSGCGFTLIELLVVVSIISLLTAILLPSLMKARILAKRVACMANFDALGNAAGLYQTDHGDYLPICWMNLADTYPHPYQSWRVTLLSNTPGVKVFNCPAAKDAGPISEVFHSVEEISSKTEKYGTANAGSYGVMYQFSLPSYITMDCGGQESQGSPAHSLVFSTVLNVAWRYPANSIYIADSCLTKGPLTYPSKSYKDYGTSAILPPTDASYFSESVTRRFADRHLGTNCLFVDGHVGNYVTAVLDSMVDGEADCVWDVE